MTTYPTTFCQNENNAAEIAVPSSLSISESSEKSSSSITKPLEQENQFILRIPAEPAQALKEAIRSDAGNLKQRLFIKLGPEEGTLDPRLRKGTVIFDEWTMSGKVMDLPTIIESQKTIDRKIFHKVADISQMLICKDGPPSEEEDSSGPIKLKRYDPNKVDKKYIYPHGICPPLKNCRKRRFRKTTKKDNEGPEMEKEVKRLFRADEEAISIKWELVDEDLYCVENSSKPFDAVDLFGALSDSENDDGVNNDQPATTLNEQNNPTKHELEAVTVSIQPNTCLQDIEIFAKQNAATQSINSNYLESKNSYNKVDRGNKGYEAPRNNFVAANMLSQKSKEDKTFTDFSNQLNEGFNQIFSKFKKMPEN